MKTIQIPTTSNPFIVNINNTAYQYRAGETAEVPDEVAEAIEDALELEPKPKRYLSKFAQLIGGSLSEVTAEDLDGIETIGSSAFKNCTALTSVVIPKTVTGIGLSAFSGCTSLKDITIPNSVKSIGNYAFYSCNNLTSIEIPDSVTSIGIEVFYGCVKLESIVVPEIPPILTNVNAFPDIDPACVFYCKTQASLDAYKAAANWSALAGTYTFVVEA